MEIERIEETGGRMNMGKWIEISKELPNNGDIVKTKIFDNNGERNIQELIRKGNLWWLPDMSMYVYYTPTHWLRR